MPYPVDDMTLFEASKVAKSTGARVRREHELAPLVWFKRGLALWYRQEDDGPLSLVQNAQYSKEDFEQPYWTILGPEDPPPPPPPPEPPGKDPDSEDPGDGGDRPPLPPVPPPLPNSNGPSGNDGGGFVVGGTGDPPLPPSDQPPDDDDQPKNPPPPPAAKITVTHTSVVCGSGPSLTYELSAIAAPKGAAFSVVFVCSLGHTHNLGLIIGTDPPSEQTLSGVATPHGCGGGSFRATPLTSNGGPTVIATDP
jgi:hypothetical protein